MVIFVVCNRSVMVIVVAMVPVLAMVVITNIVLVGFIGRVVGDSDVSGHMSGAGKAQK